MMERKKSSDFPPEVLKLFDGYIHGTLSRRHFLDNAGKFAVGTFTAAAMLEALKPNFAWAEQVKKDDARIHTEYLGYQSPQGSGNMRGYFVKPSKITGKLPGIVVVHENRGLNPHIEDVARRLALMNYVVFAPDALSPVGGYPGDEDKARELFAKRDAAIRLEDLVAAVPFLKSRSECNGRVATVGFCYGGGVVNQIAVRIPDLAAAVSFYGAQPPAAEVAKIRAPLLLHYAGNDQRINAGWPAYQAALKENKVHYEMHMYPSVEHAFYNDTTSRYDDAAAKLAWQRTLEFLEKNVRG